MNVDNFEQQPHAEQIIIALLHRPEIQQRKFTWLAILATAKSRPSKPSRVVINEPSVDVRAIVVDQL
jgi:hypothetical protein